MPRVADFDSLYKLKNEQYWLDRLDQCGRSSSQLWRSLSPLLGRDRDVAGATDHTPENFAQFFEKKVNDVRATSWSTAVIVIYCSAFLFAVI